MSGKPYFKILCSKTLQDIRDSTQRNLNAGFELAGSLFQSNTGLFVQPVLFREKENKTDDRKN